MPVQLIEFPKYVFVKDAQEYVFQKTNVLSSHGGYSYMLIRVDSASFPSAGVLEISWSTGQTLQIYNPAFAYAGESTEDYTKKLTRKIGAIALLNKHFTIDFTWADANSGYIKIKARLRGEGFNLAEVTNTVGLDCRYYNTTNDVEYENQHFEGFVDVNTNLNCEPTTQRVDDIIIQSIPDFDLNRSTFKLYELPDICAPFLGVDIPESYNRPFWHKKMFAKVNVGIFESRDNGATLLEIQDNVDFTPQLEEEIIAINGSKTEFYDGTKATFLTKTLANSIIDEKQPIWLSLFLDEAYVRYDVYVSVNWKSGGSTGIVNFAFTSKVAGTFICIPCGFHQLDFATTYPGEIPLTMDILVQKNGDDYSNQVSFVFDYRNAEYSRYFVLQNSAGALDTLRCRGVNSFETKYNRVKVDKTRTASTNPSVGTIEMVVNEEEQIWTMRTGWLLSKEELLYMRELLLSEYVAEVLVDKVEDRNNCTPLKSVALIADSIKQFDENDGYWALEWKMQYADKASVVSEEAFDKPYFNSKIVIDFHNVTLGSGTKYMNFTINAVGAYKIFINGKELSGTTYNPTSTKDIHVEIVGYTIIGVTINPNTNWYAHYFVSKIEADLIDTFVIDYFSYSKFEYLVKRLRTLMLNLFLIYSEDTIPHEEILNAIAANYLSKSPSIWLPLDFYINRPSSAPLSIPVTLAQNALIAEGATIVL